MQKFETSTEINFVDESNVFVGFDLRADCCESFGWSVTRNPPTSSDTEGVEEGLDLSGFLFDRDFINRSPMPGESFEDGGAVSFRARRGEETIYVTFWNSHNGYYGHGFEFKVGDESVYEGTL